MGTKNNLYKHKCELCKRAVANKKNSHIVPSFLVCRTASSDGTSKRNHELVYSIGKTVQVYAGNEVPQNVIPRITLLYRKEDRAASFIFLLVVSFVAS